MAVTHSWNHGAEEPDPDWEAGWRRCDGCGAYPVERCDCEPPAEEDEEESGDDDDHIR